MRAAPSAKPGPMPSPAARPSFSSPPLPPQTQPDGLPDAWEIFWFGNLACCGTNDSDATVYEPVGIPCRHRPDPGHQPVRIDEFRLLSPTQRSCLAEHSRQALHLVAGGVPLTQPTLSVAPLGRTPPRIHIEAQTLLPYVLYSASNLLDWSPCAPMPQATDGLPGYSGRQSSRQFYRAACCRKTAGPGSTPRR